MRRTYIAGNWKMNKTFQEADDFLFQLGEFLADTSLGEIEAMIFPPFTYIELAGDASEEFCLSVGAQNVSEHDQGAYTGEISADMLSSMSVDYCLVGHSERRKYFFETDAILNKKVLQLRKQFIKPVLCVGEVLSEREEGKAFEVVRNQLVNCLKGVEIDDNLLIAYEPVWAIGTGVTASPQQADEMHSFIRKWIAKEYNAETAEMLPILYGGSVNPSNLAELLSQPDIDGGLIGGAALDVASYIKMLQIASSAR
jgi:triosephosphate isomerase (TIM)